MNTFTEIYSSLLLIFRRINGKSHNVAEEIYFRFIHASVFEDKSI